MTPAARPVPAGHRPAGRAPLRLAAVAITLATQAIAALAAGPDAGLAELMQRLAARRHGHAAFVERQFIAILKRPLESSGELFYDAPDRLEKRTLAPKPESLLLDQGTLSVRRGRRSVTLAVRDYPQIAPLIDSIRATLAGDQPALERSYAPTFAGGAAGWTLVLVPRDQKLAELIASIRIAGAADQVSEVVVQRQDGDRSVMTIRELPDG